MRFADEIRDPAEEIPDLAKPDKSRPKELDMAVDLIGSMTGPWQPETYRDTYQQRVRKLIGNKKAGRRTKPEAAPAEATNVVDLTDALRRSVKRAKTSRTKSPTAGSTATKSTSTATKSSATKSSRAKASAKSPSLADMSKAELSTLAKDLDIKGRSGLTRDKLVKAIQTARRNHKKAS